MQLVIAGLADHLRQFRGLLGRLGRASRNDQLACDPPPGSREPDVGRKGVEVAVVVCVERADLWTERRENRNDLIDEIRTGRPCPLLLARGGKVREELLDVAGAERPALKQLSCRSQSCRCVDAAVGSLAERVYDLLKPAERLLDSCPGHAERVGSRDRAVAVEELLEQRVGSLHIDERRSIRAGDCLEHAKQVFCVLLLDHGSGLRSPAADFGDHLGERRQLILSLLWRVKLWRDASLHSPTDLLFEGRKNVL